MTLVLWGIAFGLAASAPLGPINFLCIRHALRFGFWGGVLTGVGSALGDAVFAAAAASGMSVIAAFMARYAVWLQLFAGLFLIAMGIHTLRQKVSASDVSGDAGPVTTGHLAVVLSTLVLTLTNPFTLTGFISMIASVSDRLAASPGYLAVTVLVLSVFAGSMLWWVFLSKLVTALRDRLTAERVGLLNRITGAAIVLFGLFVLARLVWYATG